MNKIELLRQNPVAARLLDGGPDVDSNDFLSDVRRRAAQSGRLSPAQIAAVARSFEGIDRRKGWEADRRAEAQRLADAGVKAPEGRAEVVGVVKSAKQHVSGFGESIKIVVESAEGWKVWGTAPASLLADVDTRVIEEVREAIVGKLISFTATLVRSDSDAAFAFAKRPSKAQFVSA